MATTTTEAPALTSTTAPGKVFASRSELAEHYKSPWHKYNLKRREAGLPPLLEGDFQARLQAAQEALAQQQQTKSADSHLKKGKKHKQKKNKKGADPNTGSATLSSQVPAYDRIKTEQQKSEAADTAETPTPIDTTDEHNNNDMDTEEAPQKELSPEEQMLEEAKQIEIDPRQCLFDRHISASVQDNITRMQRKYGFFVPDQECLVDTEGLIGYCHEKVKIGRMCLYCQKVFKSGEACQKHMVSTRHTKLRYEAGVDLEEFTVFYDFENANQEFLLSRGVAKTSASEPMDMDEEANSDEEWEDISDDDEDADVEVTEEEVDEEDEEMMDGYEREVAALGLDVTPLGELIFPDGRIVGHRSFRRYYKQRAPRTNDNRASVVAARHAAGDRIFEGRIVNLHEAQNAAGTNNTALAARQAGIKPSLLAGGVGKGILVSSGGAGGGFTQLSIYRYRAAVQKERRQAASGKRLQYRQKMNMNKMGKKHNRLMNGVSVAHAKR